MWFRQARRALFRPITTRFERTFAFRSDTEVQGRSLAEQSRAIERFEGRLDEIRAARCSPGDALVQAHEGRCGIPMGRGVLAPPRLIGRSSAPALTGYQSGRRAVSVEGIDEYRASCAVDQLVPTVRTCFIAEKATFVSCVWFAGGGSVLTDDNARQRPAA
jgi:hypothetical protein